MKGNEQKPRIVIAGRRNTGKSSLFNLLAGADLAIVSDTPGTTTDPVRRSMEIGGVGAVVLADTAGIDDTGGLGGLRVEKSLAELAGADLALLLFTEWGAPERAVEQACARMGTSLLRVAAKSDLLSGRAEAPEADLAVSTRDKGCREALLCTIADRLRTDDGVMPSMLGGLVGEGDTVVMVTPIDSSAPEGRMILPQVQVLRHLMDLHAQALVCQPRELPQALASLRGHPRLVITDSQAFAEVAAAVPAEVGLTSFSVVLARQKGPFGLYLQGTEAIGRLRDGDRVLIMESCSHNVTCEDIGRVKLSAALRRATGRRLECETLGGGDNPSAAARRVDEYALVVQCGGCVATRRQLRARLAPAVEAGVPVTNYGLALAWCAGIFDRATRIFRQ